MRILSNQTKIEFMFVSMCYFYLFVVCTCIYNVLIIAPPSFALLSMKPYNVHGLILCGYSNEKVLTYFLSVDL